MQKLACFLYNERKEISPVKDNEKKFNKKLKEIIDENSWQEASNKIVVAVGLADETDGIDNEQKIYDNLLTLAVDAEYPTAQYSDIEVKENYELLKRAVDKLPE